MSTETILLHPRPYAQFSGTLLLLPLLPKPHYTFSLPPEIWSHIFELALHMGDGTTSLWSLLTVCRRFKELSLPLVYSSVTISRLSTLEKFCKRLHDGDAKWDSIRRIPYSTPGRWVQSLDLSALKFDGQSQALQVDSLLTRVFPLLPFLAYFAINPAFILSRRALASLTERQGVTNIKSLRGISYVPPPCSPGVQDPLVELVRNCIDLEELEVIGQGLDPMEQEANSLTGEVYLPQTCVPLHLPRLRELTVLASLQSSYLMLCFLMSPLPSLTKLTITPYDDIPFPASFQSQFIITHAESLRSLLLLSPIVWPTRLHTSPVNLLETSPNLRHLSLENPLPALTLTKEHPLEILSIPRPTYEAWELISRLLRHLPSLKAIRARDVRWLRKGMGVRAMEAGVQGEMREWRRRLARRGIRLLDSDWRDTE